MSLYPVQSRQLPCHIGPTTFLDQTIGSRFKGSLKR